MNKKLKIMIFLSLIILIILGILLITNQEKNKNEGELIEIKSEQELIGLYKGKEVDNDNNALSSIISMPFSLLNSMPRNYGVLSRSTNRNYRTKSSYGSSGVPDPSGSVVDSASSGSNYVGLDLESLEDKSSSTKEYSTTNIQVENVDEADITKTDGDYIYSLSENKVIITNVKDPANIKIEATINSSSEKYPEDLILYKDKLVVISSKNNSNLRMYDDNTIVEIYDISNKSKPKLKKSYELYEKYYTSRCIDNMLYVISSGMLRMKDDKVIRTYKEDREEKQIELKNIKYLKDLKTKEQSIIAVADLNNLDKDIDVSSYLLNISNAYVSENSIYLLEEKYDYGIKTKKSSPIAKLFSWKGVFGAFEREDYSQYTYDSAKEKTYIYKFNILKNGNVEFSAKTNLEGKTINQYSLDEFNGHLRIALCDEYNKGARVAILDEKLKTIGISGYVGENEKMYSSRFIGNKAYIVTYKTIDPLFVIDLSNETKPKVLGELSIPGYSTYLHPYDENHLIGIGMETKETVNRDSSGRVISTSARIVGMKMALFDVTDVSNPTQISQTVIGDSRTTSAILTNPKALLFSKAKELIAIPVNNYQDDFEIQTSDETYSNVVDTFRNYKKPYVSEGYLVYKINLEEGFKLKGTIKHETNNNQVKKYTYKSTNLLRGLYIDDNLFTVSEIAIKVNNLDTLDLVSELNIK